MAEATKQVGPPTESGAGREPKWCDLGLWLVTLAWGTGAFVYSWLLAGILYDREYWKLTFEALGWADWSLAGLFGCVVGGLSFWASSAKESVKKESKQLFRIVVAVLPALFLVSALAVLTLTFATYNVYWKDARQGIATAFAALIAAVGVIVSVAVSYKTGEENRLAQQENLKTQLESQQKNLETQLEHQRTLEVEKGAREQQKLDAELIKNLNDRLHEVIARRYSSGNDKDTSGLVSASYFQLASLYKDWETLSKTSDLIALQKESQQRNILKLLFGVYQEADEKGSSDEKSTSDEKNSSDRSEVDIRTLNSVIQDIFPEVERKKNSISTSAQKEGAEYKTPDGQEFIFDLSYLDLRGLDLSRRELMKANLGRAHLEGANLMEADLAGADLWGADLAGANLMEADLAGVNLWGAHLTGADLVGAHLTGADLLGAHLERANLLRADLAGANLWGAHLAGADLWGAHLDETDLRGADLAGAHLGFANLKKADMEGAHLEGAYLLSADLEGAKLDGAHLDKASLFEVFVENPQDPELRSRIINQLKVSERLPAEEELLKVKGFDRDLVNQIIQAHKEEQADKEE